MTSEKKTTSRLSELRRQVPPRPLTPREVRQVVERQATRLLKLCEVSGPPVPVLELAAALPRVEVRFASDLPSSGRAQWNGQRWIILVDNSEAKVRQRYSIAHELAHVVWHPFALTALPDFHKLPHTARLEQACEYFAATLLMPRPWMKRAYFDDQITDIPSLARLFGVSWVAMQIRLEQLGFVDWPELKIANKEAA